jgi:hypothetical protein
MLTIKTKLQLWGRFKGVQSSFPKSFEYRLTPSQKSRILHIIIKGKSDGKTDLKNTDTPVIVEFMQNLG